MPMVFAQRPDEIAVRRISHGSRTLEAPRLTSLSLIAAPRQPRRQSARRELRRFLRFSLAAVGRQRRRLTGRLELSDSRLRGRASRRQAQEDPLSMAEPTPRNPATRSCSAAAMVVNATPARATNSSASTDSSNHAPRSSAEAAFQRREASETSAAWDSAAAAGESVAADSSADDPHAERARPVRSTTPTIRWTLDTCDILLRCDLTRERPDDRSGSLIAAISGAQRDQPRWATPCRWSTRGAALRSRRLRR